MAKCVRCGCDFDLSSARRSIGRSYGAGTYDEYYPNGDVCVSCATMQISGDVGVGEEISELMGDWDD